MKTHDIYDVLEYTKKLKPGSSLYSNILNTVFVIYALLLPFSNAFTVHTGPYILLLFWMLEGGFKVKFEKIKSQKTIWFLLAFFVFNIISLLWTDNIKSGLHYLKYYFVVTVVVVTLFTSLKKTYALPVLFSLFVSIFVTEISLYGWYMDMWHLKGTTGVYPLQHMNRIMYSIFLAITAFLLLWQVLNKKNKIWLRIISIVLLVSTVFTLFIGYGRTGQLAFLFGFFIFSFVYWRKKRRYLFIAFLVLASLVIAAYTFSSPFKQRVQTTILDIKHIKNDNLKGSWGIRLAAKVVSGNAIKEHPVLGTGIGDFNDAFHQSALNSQMKHYKYVEHLAHPHDQFFVIALQTGIVGLIIFVLLLWFLLQIKCINNLNKAIISSLVAVFVVAFFSDFSLQNYISGLFGFVVGYFLNRNSEQTLK